MQDSKPDSSRRKALCILADQSRMQRAINHHKGGTVIIPASRKEVNAAHALLENIIEPMIHCTRCEGLLIEYAEQTGGDLNKAARAWMEENIDVLYAAEYAAQQLLSEAMDTLQMLPKEEVCNNA